MRKSYAPHRRSLHQTAFSRTSSTEYFLEAIVACKSKRASSVGTPSPDTCGEDSYFMANHILGIADGVGGWNSKNVDPSKISRALMKHASDLVGESSNHSLENNEETSPMVILDSAYSKTLLDPEVEAGSTTACILKLHNEEKRPGKTCDDVRNDNIFGVFKTFMLV